MDEQVRTACGSGCVRTGRLLAESNMSNGSLSYHLPGHRGACRSCARSIRPGRRRRPLRFLGQGTQHGGLPRPVPRYCPGLGRRTYDRGLPGLPDSPRISLHQHSTSHGPRLGVSIDGVRSLQHDYVSMDGRRAQREHRPRRSWLASRAHLFSRRSAKTASPRQRESLRASHARCAANETDEEGPSRVKTGLTGVAPGTCFLPWTGRLRENDQERGRRVRRPLPPP